MEPWLTTFRCSENPLHLLYVEEAVAGRLETSVAEELGCLWGCAGVMERLPGEFEVVVTGLIRGVETPAQTSLLPAPTEPAPPPA